MRKLNSLSIGVATASIGRLPRPISAPKYRRTAAIIAMVSQELSNATGIDIAIDANAALLIMKNLCGAWALSFGRVAPEIIDDSLTFDELRLLGEQMVGRDQRFNGVPLKDYANGVVVPADGSVIVQFELFRPFFVEKAGTKLDEWAAWPAQLEQMSLAISRGSGAMKADVTLSAPADVTIYVDEVDAAAKDGWAPVPRLFRNEDSGLEHSGPAGGGGLLALAEVSSPGDSTALGIISLLRAGDRSLHEDVEVAQIVANSFLRRDQGSDNTNTLATTLFELPETVGLEDVPTAAEFTLKQVGGNAHMRTRWLYVPTVTTRYAEGIAAKNITAQGDGETAHKLVTATALRGQEVPGHVSAIASIVALPVSHPRADLLDGILTSKHGTSMHLSPVAHAAAPSMAHSPALLAQSISIRARSVPGARSPSRAEAGGGAPLATFAQQAAPKGLWGNIASLFGGR